MAEKIRLSLILSVFLLRRILLKMMPERLIRTRKNSNPFTRAPAQSPAPEKNEGRTDAVRDEEGFLMEIATRIRARTIHDSMEMPLIRLTILSGPILFSFIRSKTPWLV
jgi:hypothetical protein